MEQYIPHVLTGIAGLAVLLVLKYNLREKLITKIEIPCRAFGEMISKFLIIRLGSKGAERFEEGVLVTGLDILEHVFKFVKEGLLFDNEIKKKGS